MDKRVDFLPVEEAKHVIFDNTVDLSIDISEYCIDALLNKEIIKDIPVLGSVFKVGKVAYSISRMAYIKKLLIFVQEMQKNDITGEKIKNHKNKLDNNPKNILKR